MILTGKTALVTGGGRGIGGEIALELARCGCHVSIHYHASEKGAREVVGKIERLGQKAHAVKVDQASVASIQQGITASIAALGKIDILVNNATIFFKTPLSELTESDWDRTLTTNLKGPFFYAKLAAPHIPKGGCIINIADVYGKSPAAAYLPYGISKAGVIAMTKGLAKALAPDIRVNCISPGIITPAPFPPPSRGGGGGRVEFDETKIPLHRCGTPADIAKGVAYLAAADYITGEIHTISGGYKI